MDMNLEIRFMSPAARVYCFRHAVQAMVKDNIDFDVEIDEFGLSGNDLRSTACVVCREERERDANT